MVLKSFFEYVAKGNSFLFEEFEEYFFLGFVLLAEDGHFEAFGLLSLVVELASDLGDLGL